MDSARVGQHEDEVIQIQKMRRISEYLLENHGRLPFFWEIFILARYDFRFFRFWFVDLQCLARAAEDTDRLCAKILHIRSVQNRMVDQFNRKTKRQRMK